MDLMKCPGIFNLIIREEAGLAVIMFLQMVWMVASLNPNTDPENFNNANFSTDEDGVNPRMQMYLFTTSTIRKDGDLDNGVISHEYTHGISNRLTGGPSNAGCLQNGEQMG
jgi:hypothetical protein